MKKIMKKLVLLSMLFFGFSSFAQLKVINSFGKGLNVESGGITIFIPDKEVGSFKTRNQAVTLSCWTTDNKVKFSVSKSPSRNGVVIISPSDAPVAPVVSTANISSSPLDNILTGGDYTGSNSTSGSNTTIKVSENLIFGGQLLTLEYRGSRSLKIVSQEGQGLELIPPKDSTGNKYSLYVNKGTDLVLGVVEKQESNQAIWPYGEIRKRVNLDDSVCKITDNDIQMMSSGDTKKVKFRLEAKDYKILIKPATGEELISLAYQEASKTFEIPIGQSYVRISYTDPQGEFHPTAFMPIHVTGRDRYVEITTNSLAKALVIKNF